MPCKYCDVDTHSTFTCGRKPRKPLQATKRLKKKGKLAAAYYRLRVKYFEDHPGDEHYCYYCLYIGIEVALTRGEVQVEHFMSKARHPELRFERSNLVASCPGHNKDKGSRDGDEYLEILDKQMKVNIILESGKHEEETY